MNVTRSITNFDARERIRQKTKFVDARVKIQNRKAQKQIQPPGRMQKQSQAPGRIQGSTRVTMAMSPDDMRKKITLSKQQKVQVSLPDARKRINLAKVRHQKMDARELIKRKDKNKV